MAVTRKNRRVKLAQDFTGIGTKKRLIIEDQKARKTYSFGQMNTELIEPVPYYHRAACEIVNFDSTGSEAAKNNCWVILGRDRFGDIDTGYGGKGHTQSGAIYICAGMSSAEPYEEEPPSLFHRNPLNGMPHPAYFSPKPDTHPGGGLMTDRSFDHDAAFIYLSQKCSIDDYLSLGGVTIERAMNQKEYKIFDDVNDVRKVTKYNTRKAADPRSAVAVKADNVRLVGRESIRLQVNPQRHSQGDFAGVAHGISLVGSGDAQATHPIPLGYRLIGAMEHLHEALGTIADGLEQFIRDQTDFNRAMQGHTHIGFGGQPTTDVILPTQARAIAKGFKTYSISYSHLRNFRTKLGTWKSNYTKPGKKYILSQNVFCD